MPDSEPVLDLILQALGELIEYELAVILEFKDERSQQLVVQKARGPLANKALSGHQIDLRQRSDLAEIMNTGQPFLFDDDGAHIDTYAGILDLPDQHSCLVVPLHFMDKPVGLLTLDHRSCYKFNQAIVRFTGSISRLIAIILNQNRSSRLLLNHNLALAEERNLLLQTGGEVFSNLIGSSAAWQAVKEKIRMVAGSDLPVLIEGETGTGKEEAARAIHSLSVRANGPFVALNCSALSPELAESELFGHEKGAFTSAMARRRGRFEIADGGTLFLDELADLPSGIQPKLLRVLQQGSFERVGGEQTLYCNVRIIAATNRNLADEVRLRHFREDLYYRLSVFPLILPPLRERDRDILLLASFFLKKIASAESSSPLVLDGPALDVLLDYSWPGNVRELQNAMHRAALLARGGVIRQSDLALVKDQHRHVSPAVCVGHATVNGSRADSQETLLSMDEVSRRHIMMVLNKSGGKIYGTGGAAEILQIKPTTLQSRMRRLGIR